MVKLLEAVLFVSLSSSYWLSLSIETIISLVPLSLSPNNGTSTETESENRTDCIFLKNSTVSVPLAYFLFTSSVTESPVALPTLNTLAFTVHLASNTERILGVICICDSSTTKSGLAKLFILMAGSPFSVVCSACSLPARYVVP